MEGFGGILFLLVHGNNGSASDWVPLTKRLAKRFAGCHILCASSFEGRQTLVGLEELGERLARETSEYVTRHCFSSETVRLVCIAHSLGGLIVRSALPAILGALPHVRPEAYFSISSPHLGVCRPGGGAAKLIWKTLTEATCRFVYGQTGRDLTYLDGANNFLELMAEPEGPYVAAWKAFTSRTLIATPFFDMVVPHATASISTRFPYSVDEYAGSSAGTRCQVWGYSGFDADDEYHHFLEPYCKEGARDRLQTCPVNAKYLDERWGVDENLFLMFPRSVLANLQQSLSFRRLDVAMHVHSRWQTHDSFLQKSIGGCVPNSGPSGDAFQEMLVELIAIDLKKK